METAAAVMKKNLIIKAPILISEHVQSSVQGTCTCSLDSLPQIKSLHISPYHRLSFEEVTHTKIIVCHFHSRTWARWSFTNFIVIFKMS